METFFVAEFGYGAALVKCKGVMGDKSCKVESHEVLIGYFYVGRSGRILLGDDKKAFRRGKDAVAWLVQRVQGKIDHLHENIKEYEADKNSLLDILKLPNPRGANENY